MKDTSIRGLHNALSLLYSAPEFDRIRLFYVSEMAEPKPDPEALTKIILDEIRTHLVTHSTAVAAMKRGL